MSQPQAVRRTRLVQTEDTLAALLYYWQRGMLSCDEMLSRWHACHLTEEELARQVRELLFQPLDRRSVIDGQRWRRN